MVSGSGEEARGSREAPGADLWGSAAQGAERKQVQMCVLAVDVECWCCGDEEEKGRSRVSVSGDQEVYVSRLQYVNFFMVAIPWVFTSSHTEQRS